MEPCGQRRLGDEHGLGGPAHVAAAGNLEEAFHLRQQHPLAIDVFYRRVNTIGARPMATRRCRAAPYSRPPTSAAPRPRFRWRGALSNRPVPSGKPWDLFEFVWRILHGLNLMAMACGRGR